MAPQAHALLGASSAHRWLTCTPSARLEEAQGEPDRGSVYADEGTAAHEYAEILLSHRLNKINNRSFSGRMKKVKAGQFWGPEMEEAINDYADYVLETVEGCRMLDPEVYVDLEQRVDYSAYVPEGFGTADVCVIADGTLHVIDLKYGKGVAVSAVDNPQLRLYALGAALKYRVLFDFKDVAMTIMQPRLGSVSTDALTLDELLMWAETVAKPAVELAYEGKGELHPSESACRWCRAKATCRARADEAIAQACTEFDDGPGFAEARFDAANPPTPEDVTDHAPLPELLTAEEVAAILPALPRIQAWAKDMEDWALEQARDHGVRFPGYKLVEGRSVRKIVDAEGADMALEQAGYDAEDVYKTPELKPIGQLEKLLGKKRFEEVLGEYVEKPAGKPTLVPEDDKRPEISSTESAIADFEDAA